MEGKGKEVEGDGRTSVGKFVRPCNHRVDVSAEEQRWWKELRRPCCDVTYCPSGSADCPAISTGIIISARKFSSGDERSSPYRHRRRIAIKLFAMGEKPPDLPPFHFFFSLLFRVAWKLRKLFRAVQLAFRNKKYKLTYLIRFFSSKFCHCFSKINFIFTFY